MTFGELINFFCIQAHLSYLYFSTLKYSKVLLRYDIFTLLIEQAYEEDMNFVPIIIRHTALVTQHTAVWMAVVAACTREGC